MNDRVFFNCDLKGIGHGCKKKVILTRKQATIFKNENKDILCGSCEIEMEAALGQQCWSVSDG